MARSIDDIYTVEEQALLRDIERSIRDFRLKSVYPPRNFEENPIKLDEIWGTLVFRQMRNNTLLLSSILNKEKETNRLLALLQSNNVAVSNFQGVSSLLCGRLLNEDELRDLYSTEDLTDKDVPVIVTKVRGRTMHDPDTIHLRSRDSVMKEILIRSEITNARGVKPIDPYGSSGETILKQLQGIPQFMLIKEVLRSREEATKKLIAKVNEPIPQRAVDILINFSGKFTEDDYMHTSNRPISGITNTATDAGDEMMDVLRRLQQEEPDLHQQIMNLPIYNDADGYEQTFGDALAAQGGKCGAAFQVKVRKMLFELGVGKQDDRFYRSDLEEEEGIVPRGRHWQWRKNLLNVVSNEKYESIKKSKPSGSGESKGLSEASRIFLAEKEESLRKLIERISEIDERAIKGGKKLTEEEIIKNAKSKGKNELLNQYLVTTTGEGNANLVVQDVLGDGNCFYYAISHQLARQGIILPNGSDHEALRRLAINEIATHPGVYRGFTESLDNFLAHNLNAGVYADHVMIFALANALHMNVNIYHGNGTITPIQVGGGGALDVYYTGNHYMSVLQVDNAHGLAVDNSARALMDKGKFLRTIAEKSHETSLSEIQQLGKLLDKNLVAAIRNRDEPTLTELTKLVGKDAVDKMTNCIREHDLLERAREEAALRVTRATKPDPNKKDDKGCSIQ